MKCVGRGEQINSREESLLIGLINLMRGMSMPTQGSTVPYAEIVLHTLSFKELSLN